MMVALKEKLELMKVLQQIGQDLASIRDLDELLNRIMSVTTTITQSEASSILLVDENTNDLYFKVALGSKGDEVKKIRIPLDNKQSIAGWVAINKKPVIVSDASKDPRFYKKADEESQFQTKNLLAVPVMWGGKVLGVIEALNKLENQNFSEEDTEHLSILAGQAAVAINNATLVESLHNYFIHTTEILVNAIEERDPMLRGHTHRIVRAAAIMGKTLELPHDQFEALLYGAYFHDIGKLQLPCNTPFIKDQTHPAFGEEMLRHITLLKPVLPIIRHHQERWDGSGFPDKLKEEEIPLEARIISILEYFDESWVMLNSPSAKESFIEEFISEFGIKYDPGLKDVFIKILPILTEDNPL